MKSITLRQRPFLVMLLLLPALTACWKRPVTNLSGGKRLTVINSLKISEHPAWVEDFNQTGSFDTSKWSKISGGTSDWDKHMSDRSECYAIRDGKLVLRGFVNPDLKRDPRPYLTGGISTKGKVDFDLGRIEIRAKFSSGKGAWPALWMVQSTGTYPSGGEIDMMEHLNYDKAVYQTIHTAYTLANGNPNVPQRFAHVTFNENEFNTFAVEKYQDSVVFYVNNKRSFAYLRTPINQFPFADVKHYLLLDMQLGGSWVGTIDPKTLPVEMEIDWVKYYPLIHS
ncbi:glycoside hydrolase family 16 protein [Pedobacter cryoconitis]|uniref:Beta-glucanase (GH16 family) n=1 Tax=Pedobacter cryoconitis TaxID=188932 RepID=A0A7X0J0W1_9SPHI|nr:glycoside hydrolase family 16 protein [Pedobacter cryoconitis]MBB6498758.1 beta-glucanase (GH16 family) [Pedobacter cryoconitis]